MQSPQSLIAVGIGVIVALSPVGVAGANPSQPGEPNSTGAIEDDQARFALANSDQPEADAQVSLTNLTDSTEKFVSRLPIEPRQVALEALSKPSGSSETAVPIAVSLNENQPAAGSNGTAIAALNKTPAPTASIEEQHSTAVPAPTIVLAAKVKPEPVADEALVAIATPAPSPAQAPSATLRSDRMASAESTASAFTTPAANTATNAPAGNRLDSTAIAQTSGTGANSPDSQFPFYVEPPANPLQFPTTPDEVQIAGTQPLTLVQALELAQRNNRELQVAELELERARAALRETQAELYPTVSAGANLVFVQTDQPTSNNPFVPVPELDDITTSLTGNLQINYDVFTSGGRGARIRASEGQVRLQELQVETLSEQLRQDVSNDYYDMQEADEQVRIARDSLAQSQQSLRDAQALENAGVGTRFDVLQAQVDVANSQQELVQALSDQQVARRQLARRLSLAQSVNVSAADPVAVASEWDLTLEESIVLAYKNRAELEQQLVQREISGDQRRAALSTLGPQISLFAQYSAQEQFNNNQGNDSFNDDYQFGAQLNIDLYDGGAARARARQEEINAAIAEVNFANQRNDVRFQVEEAYLNLQANRANIDTAAVGLAQARESLRLARLRFQAGVGTQTEVLDAQTELTRAEVNQVRAILGYNRSLVALQRAVSNLPDSQLSDLPNGVGDRIEDSNNNAQ